MHGCECGHGWRYGYKAEREYMGCVEDGKLRPHHKLHITRTHTRTHIHACTRTRNTYSPDLLAVLEAVHLLHHIHLLCDVVLQVVVELALQGGEVVLQQGEGIGWGVRVGLGFSE